MQYMSNERSERPAVEVSVLLCGRHARSLPPRTRGDFAAADAAKAATMADLHDVLGGG